MTTFHKGRSGNPAGRPPGAMAVNRAKLRRAFNVAVDPHVVEILQRAVEKALAGDSAALAGLLHIIGNAMALADTPKPAGPVEPP